ncbi:MAG: hypothetical protein E7660_02270 [Ruminococcaceae bacterium]|nr:hypothetical protein [Oscillospiraceae bacterium]
MFDREYLKRVGFAVAGAILGIAVAFYIGYHIWHKVTSFVEFEPAIPHTVTVTSEGEGYIFRDETVLSTEETGSFIPTLSDGERVGSFAEVARIYSGTSAETGTRIDEINAQLEVLSSVVYADNLTTKDVTKLDGDIYALMAEISRCVSNGKYGEASARRSELLTLINKRTAASGETHDFRDQIDALQKEKAELSAKFGTLKQTVYAPVSGWYYSKVDGCENIFTSKNIETLTYESFKEYTRTVPEAVTNSAGKIVTDCRWYFVCEMTKDKLKEKAEGAYYTLYFPYNGGEKLTMKLHSVSLGEDGMGIAVFTTDKCPVGFDFARVQSYEILEEEYTGFKVPQSAVRIVDGQMGVYVLTGEIVHFRRIEVIHQHENYYLVTMSHKEPEPEETEAETTAEEGAATEAPEETTVPLETETDTSEETAEPEKYYSWLELNENIITSGKGLRDGRIITNLN